ncbi:MAG: hypothetical protein ACKVX7_15860 [Planctomycetota bacterium]
MNTVAQSLLTTSLWTGAAEPPAELQRACQQLDRLADEWRRGAARPELRDQAHEALWCVLAAWSSARAAAEAEQPPETLGNWALTPAEALLVNAGFVYSCFCADRVAPVALLEALAPFATRETTTTEYPIICASSYLLERLRVHLGINRRLVEHDQSAALSDEVARANEHIAKTRTELHALLDEHPATRELLPQQRQLDELQPAVSRLTALGRQGGVDAQQRRLQMKVFETARRLTLAISTAINSYDRRKRYEMLTNAIAEATIVLQARDDELRKLSAPLETISPRIARERMKQALSDLRAAMGKISQTSGAQPPPYILEHLPRLTPDSVLGLWQRFVGACPRFARHAASQAPPRILLLPGVGNAVYQRESDEVLAAIFPTEVRLQAIFSALVEAYWLRDAQVRTEYVQAKKLDSLGEAGVLASFRKDCLIWIDSFSSGAPALDRAPASWLKQIMA